MKITKEYLKKIILEELNRVVCEQEALEEADKEKYDEIVDDALAKGFIELKKGSSHRQFRPPIKYFDPNSEQKKEVPQLVVPSSPGEGHGFKNFQNQYKNILIAMYDQGLLAPEEFKPRVVNREMVKKRRQYKIQRDEQEAREKMKKAAQAHQKPPPKFPNKDRRRR